MKKRLERDTTRDLVGGVCEGLGNYFNIDPIIFRILFVLGTLFGPGGFILTYIILWIAMPEKKY